MENTQDSSEYYDDSNPKDSEKYESEKVLDKDKLGNNMVEYFKKPAKDTSKMDRLLTNTVHMGMTLVTGGLWAVGYIAYNYYKGYSYSKKQGHYTTIYHEKASDDEPSEKNEGSEGENT